MKKFRATTLRINVDVTPSYMGKRSFDESMLLKQPHEYLEYTESFPKNIWKYTVDIENQSYDTFKIVARQLFYVSYMNKFKGHILEISGKGIDNNEPILFPGTKYTYNSLTYLQTPKGMMYGHYIAETINKKQLIIQIPPTALEYSSK